MAAGRVTRRMAMTLVGGSLVMAVGSIRSGHVVSAQEASPVASPVGSASLMGQRLVLRIRTVKAGQEPADILAKIQDGFVPLVAAIPGMALYVAVANPETRALFSIGVFADEASAAESSRVAGDWVKTNIPDVFEGDPEVHNGVIGVSTPAPASDLLGTYVVIRLRQPSPDWKVDDVMRLIGEGYISLVEKIPGFVAYFGSSDAKTGGQAYVTIFDDPAGTQESTRVAGEWLKANNYTFFTGDPTLAEGEIGAAAQAPE